MKQESFVTKGNRQIALGDTPDAMKTVADGLDYYQNKRVSSPAMKSKEEISLTRRR